jgi:hypothetical protein
MGMDTGTNGNTAYSNETPKDERAEVLRNDRAQHQPIPARGSTYLSKAVASVGQELGGRYAHLGRETTVVGARPLDAEGLATGHDAMRLQRERMAQGLPHYPRQDHPFAADVGNIERPFPVNLSAPLPDPNRVP